MRFFAKTNHQPDYRFIGIIALIVVFGLIMLSSASVSLAFEKFGDSYYLLKHQIIYGLIPGIFFLVVFSLIDFRFWKKIAFTLLIFSIILLLLVFLPGIGAGYGTAKSWLNIFGVSFQPSELVKLTFIIYLAALLEKRGEKKVKDFSEGLKPFATVLIIIIALLVLQPDLGTMTIIAIVSLIIYYVAGAERLHILGFSMFALFGLYILVKIAPYRVARLMTFLHPELDPQGIGYHINQAFLAIGSGGILGRGFGMSRQKFQYLPEVAGDSIFAVIGEELGFIICVILVLALIYLMYRGFKIAQGAPDNFSKLFVTGVVSWIMVQSFFNIGAMVGLMPLTGVPLPFISYGGTALAVLLAACGIVINISRQTRD
jgi:cell division protein FtsW